MPELQIKNVDLWNALVPSEPSEKAPLAHLAALPLPAKTAYALTKLLRKATDEFKDLDTARGALVQQYAKKDANGEPIKTDDGNGVQLENADAFVQAFAELLDQPVTLSGVTPIAADALGDAAISADVLVRVGPFVTDPV